MRFQDSNKQDFLDVLRSFCNANGVKRLHSFEIEDHFFQESLVSFCHEMGLDYVTYKSPMFFSDKDTFSAYLESSKKPFMKTYYEQERKKHGILMDGNKPVGGKWSFDEDNRKKTPKDIQFPELPVVKESVHHKSVKSLIESRFSDHPGTLDTIWFPTNRQAVHAWFSDFIEQTISLVW